MDINPRYCEIQALIGVIRVKEALSHHLRDRVLPDRDNLRLLDELGWHNDQGSLLRFLDEPSSRADEQHVRAGAAVLR